MCLPIPVVRKMNGNQKKEKHPYESILRVVVKIGNKSTDQPIDRFIVAMTIHRHKVNERDRKAEEKTVCVN